MENFFSLKTTLVGSFPTNDPNEALELVVKYSDIPAWPQLSKRKIESMIIQFNEGLPGFDFEKEVINTSSPEFETKMVEFYEDYLKLTEEKDTSILNKYAISEEMAKGFHAFLSNLKGKELEAVKGQITGPFTLGIALKIETGENPIFREDLRDLIVKFIGVKAVSQGTQLKSCGKKVIIFLDEPGLSGFGSSAFITISKDDVLTMLNEIFELLENFDIIPGIHVCANTSWDVVLDSKVKILNFDSFSYFDKFLIYSQNIKSFLEKEGRYIAWGIVPTDSEGIEKTSLEEVTQKFFSQLEELVKVTGLDKDFVLEKSIFTPACGLGSLKKDQAIKALELLKGFKEKLEH
ncbi:MAG: hypothetical protein GXO57_04440 [Thermodesulfobacteria bacterium]|nr:hypothetical protein [Thermodesulfobacteriota bacterium]